MRPQSYVQSIRSAFPDRTRYVHESCPQRGQPPCRSHLALTMQGSLAASVRTRAGHGSRGVLEATARAGALQHVLASIMRVVAALFVYCVLFVVTPSLQRTAGSSGP